MPLTQLADRATQLADRFIPASIAADREANKLARIFLYSHLFGPFIGLTVPLAVIVFEGQVDYKSAILFGSIFAFWFYPLALKASAAYRTLAFISVQNLIFCILWSCYCYGGVRSPTLAWLATIPLLAFLYMGPSTRLRLALIAQFAFSAAMFFALDTAFPPPPVAMAPVAIEALGLVSTSAAALYVAMMALFYANALASQVELKAEIDRHLRTTADLVAAVESARRSSAAKAEFIAKMSHELRTPLNAVIGYSEILLDEAESENDPHTASDLRRIHGAGEHLLRLVNDILDLSRIDAGRMEVSAEIVDCGDLLRRVAEEFEPAAERAGLRILVDARAGGVVTDAAKLTQILDQIVENAVAFTQRGVVALSAEMREGDAGERVTITVSDTGCGIGRDRLENFFERLETVEEADGRQEGGAGVGLLLCKRLCDLIGATLSIESEIGRGTRVTVRLQAAADAVDALEQAQSGAAGLKAVADIMRRVEAAEPRRSEYGETASG